MSKENNRQPLPAKKQVIATGVIQQEYHISSPFPPAEMLAQYDAVVPGAAERLIALVEKQSAHRIQLESVVIPQQIKQSSRGQIFGFISTLCAFSISAYCFYKGYVWAGGTIATGTVVSLATLFLTGKASVKGNLDKKKPNSN